jgi:hypothetical protein
LDGIGYREQELQTAKGTNFESEKPNGVNYASYGGGTHIFIMGVGLQKTAELNRVLLTSTQLNATVAAPPLSEEDVFNSHPQLGAIAYRLPSISNLFQLPGDMFDHFSTLTFYISVQSGQDILTCASNAVNKCRVIYR